MVELKGMPIVTIETELKYWAIAGYQKWPAADALMTCRVHKDISLILQNLKYLRQIGRDHRECIGWKEGAVNKYFG